MLAKKYTLLKPLMPARYCSIYGTKRIGNRDVVGHGVNGTACYKDDAHFPFPSVRFQENSPFIKNLRKKEAGDWKALTLQEKKSLYRASFCQTFAEFKHPTGQWKFVLGGVLFFTGLGFWVLMFFKHFVYNPLPASLSEKSQRRQLRRMLDLHVNPIDGLASKWDYDNDCWKGEKPSKPAVQPPSPDPLPPCDSCDCGAISCQCGGTNCQCTD